MVIANGYQQVPGLPAGPCTLVILGANGDLTRRLLMPSLQNLSENGNLPHDLTILGVDRRTGNSDQYRRETKSFMQGVAASGCANFDLNESALDEVLSKTQLIGGDFNSPQLYQDLKVELQKLHSQNEGNVLFYMATPPLCFADIVCNLSRHGLTQQTEGWRRVIVEKPFGYDLETARALNQKLLKYLQEDQIYRIDHYLGKRPLEEFVNLRCHQRFLEPFWNRQHIESVQISATEMVSVEKRGAFYDSTGAMRDMVPNHIFQMLMAAAMEVPTSFDADAVRDEKSNVLLAIKPFDQHAIEHDVVRGQYVAGHVGHRSVTDYRAEHDVNPHSTTETFVAMKLAIDTERWAGVPFYLRTGKAMAKRETEIAINFKHPVLLFDIKTDRVVFHIAPTGNISIISGDQVHTVSMEAHVPAQRQTGYEPFLYDCMRGDATRFQRGDTVELAWAAVDPILQTWKQDGGKVHAYEAGSWGPKAAERFFSLPGHTPDARPLPAMPVSLFNEAGLGRHMPGPALGLNL